MYSIRPATGFDLPALPHIERAAAAQFRDTPYPHLADAPLASEHLDPALDLVWVAADNADAPVAFVLVRKHDNAAHIREIDVHPACARQRLGARLVRAVVDWALRQSIPFVTLTTFDDVPWNAPYYSRLGFVVLTANEWTTDLQSVRRAEQLADLPMAHRVCMRLQVE